MKDNQAAQYQRDYLRVLGIDTTEGVWVPKSMVRMLGGNANDAIMLRQILYWWIKNNELAFYKRHGHDKSGGGWEDETGLRAHQSRASVQRLVKLRYIKTWRGHGYDNKMATYYEVDEDVLYDACRAIHNLPEGEYWDDLF